MKRDTLNLTLDERHKFESLLAEYANAEMDVMRATGRRHDALSRIREYVNDRTNQLATEAYHEGVASVVIVQTHDERAVEVPTGTPSFNPSPLDVAHVMGIYVACTPDEIADGRYHTNGPWVPVKNCSCRTCVEHRNGARGAPILDVSGGN